MVGRYLELRDVVLSKFFVLNILLAQQDKLMSVFRLGKIDKKRVKIMPMSQIDEACALRVVLLPELLELFDMVWLNRAFKYISLA